MYLVLELLRLQLAVSVWLQKQFDWFGAYIVGLVTAIGGGTLRDLLLDQPPFGWNKDGTSSVLSWLYFLWLH